MKPDTFRLSTLIDKVAKAREPSRPLFAEVWFASTGKQDPDTKVRFAFFMQANAWVDAALITVAHTLPEWGSSRGLDPGRAKQSCSRRA